MTDPNETPSEALARNQRRLRTEGLDAATDAAIQLLRDPKAPAQAKSATINAVFRASGLLGRAEEDSEPDLHEMTPEQLERAARRAMAHLKGAEAGEVFD